MRIAEAGYLGDFPADQAVYFMWNTYDSNGASVTRATDGVVAVYKDNSDGSSFDQTQVTTGVTDDEDVDGLTGVHSIAITTTNAWYEIGHDYVVVLSAAGIDGQTVNTAIATFSIENRPVDMTRISGDITAADNLESQYDTTGVAGDTFPATQAQLAGIANVGSAVNRPAASYTLTTGTQSSGTFASTAALDGTNHEHTSADNVMDLYYEFSIGSGIPTSVTITGYLNNNNDDLEVQAYDWVAIGWVQIGTLVGKNQSTNEVDSYELFVNMVGSGANEGLVRVRFTDGAFTLSTATLAIDQIFLSFSRGAEGYGSGAIWIDTTVSNTNTVVGVDGTARNPVSTIAAANTLSASTNLNRFEVAPGSTITFAASQDNQVFNGVNWTLALGGQSISGSHITGANISGVCTGATSPEFSNCHFSATTLPPSRIDYSNLLGTITAGSAGDFFFDRCHSGIAGTSAPVFDFGGALAASNANFRGYSGGIEIQNMGAGAGTYNMSLEGDGALTINANCSATSSVVLRGNFILTDNASGAVTVTRDDNSTNIAAIPTTAMRGTDSAALASIATEARLAELDATNIPADIDAMPTTAMRGTDGANTTVPDAAGTAAGLHVSTDALIAALNDPTTAAIATAVMAKVVDGTLDVTESLKILVAVLAGDMAVSGSTYTYDEQDGTVKVTETIGGSTVTRTIA